MINCGIIGYGKMGKTRARAIEESNRGQIKAIYDTRPLADDPDAKYPIYENEEAIINDPEIDAIFVCTPNFRIVPLVKQALQAGKHVFSEKPPAFTAAEVEDVREVEAAAKGLKLMYGFNHRHHASIQRMKEIITSGDMGKVLWMRGRYGKEVDQKFFDGWRAKRELSGGGIMLDQGIHMLDLFLYLGGNFDEVHALVSNLFWKIEGIEDNVFAIFRNRETGLSASLHSTMTQWRYLFSLEIFLEGGALVLNGLKTSSGAYGDEDLAIKRNVKDVEQGRFDEEEHVIYHSDVSWLSEINYFFDHIEQDSPVELGSSQDALTLMRMMDRIYEHQTA